ncbi:peptidase S24 [Paenibacillus sp. N10]|uniref:Peptidase S24 n=2 Tax=Paenibacillus lutrae TaxID=2078573 RepID=A0A7X3FHA3_9BACL|nr:peptidase S24 [Paenibacillus lutrae]
MLPLIREGSVCTFEQAGPDEVQRGDIVLFEAADGGLIAHRLIRRTGSGGGAVFYCKGDANIGFDLPVAAGNLLARLVQIRRGTRTITGDMLRFKLWGRVMTALPGLARVNRLAARLSKHT